jgi:hypothetical protein
MLNMEAVRRPTFMLYRLDPLTLDLVGRRLGSGGAPLLTPFKILELLSETDVFGVVVDDASVEDDLVRSTVSWTALTALLPPIPFCVELLPDFSVLCFLRRPCQREGMIATPWTATDDDDQGRMDDEQGSGGKQVDARSKDAEQYN